MVAYLLVFLMRYPMGACSPINHVLVEVTNQVRKITKTTIST
jgi:hypothetical protein